MNYRLASFEVFELNSYSEFVKRGVSVIFTGRKAFKRNGAMARLLTPMIVLLAFVLIGCGTGGSPTFPGDTGQGAEFCLQSPYESHSNHYLWGLWDISIDAASMEAMVVLVRGADFHLNAVKFLEVTPCTDCLTVGNIKLCSPNDISVDVTLKHPFPGNLNTTGFDVRGIFITDYDQEWGYYQFSWGETEPRLLNADGYIDYFYVGQNPYGPDILKYYPGKYSNGEDMSAKLNPFVAYSKDVPRRMFLPGTEETRTLNIHVPEWPFKFGYAVDACWAPPGKQVTDPITDFPPEANCNEAYQVSVTIEPGLDPWPGSSSMVNVQAFDHQGPQTVNICDLDPYGIDDSYNIDMTSVVQTDGSVLFTGAVHNSWEASPGDYLMVVSVYDTQFDSNLGKCGAYQVVPIEVLPMQQHDPIAVGDAYPKLRTAGDQIEFRDMGSYDPDGGAITKWEWDFDDDGIYDAEGYDKYHAYDTPGEYDIQFRVTDDDGKTGVLHEPIHVSVKTGPGWARVWPAISGWDVTTSPTGDVYVVGYWYGNEIDFDPGLGEEVHSEPGDFTAYLVKYDSTGIFKWARTWGSTGYYAEISANSVRVDSNGNIFVSGIFNWSVDFDPGPGEDIHESNDGSLDAYVIKLASDGSYQWVRIIGGTGVDYASGLGVDAGGNVYVGGAFIDTADLDPGTGTDLHVSNGGMDAFLVKLDGDANYQWGRSWGSALPSDDDPDSVFDLSAGYPGHVYAAGYFCGLCDFDPGSGEEYHEAVDFEDAYLSVFTSSGEFEWARTWGGGWSDAALSVAASNSGDIYAAGTFGETVDFDPGPVVNEHTSAGQGDAFLSKFDYEGNFIWAGTWGSLYGGSVYYDTEDACSVAIDDSGNVLVTGRYLFTTDFDPGPGVNEHTPPKWTGYEIYLSKFNPLCEFLWVTTWGGDSETFDDSSSGVACGPYGVVYVTGDFDGTCDFDPGPGVDLHTDPISSPTEPFLTKFGPDGQW